MFASMHITVDDVIFMTAPEAVYVKYKKLCINST